jgi:chaperonin GroEL
MRSTKKGFPQKRRTPGVVFQPQAADGLRRGVHLIIDAIQPTLGPLPRRVAITGANRDQAPELLDCGGLIARRVVQINDRDGDIGAMYLRQVLWKIYEEAGDATATTAVLFGSIFDEGLKMLRAGANPMLLRSAFEQGMRVILDELDGMAAPVETERQLQQIALGVCPDEPLAAALGEIFDLIGAFGALRIQGGHGREPYKEYIQGAYWEAGLASKDMLTNIPRQRSDLYEAHLLISDLELEDTAQVGRFLDMAYRSGVHNLLLMGNKFSEAVTSMLAGLPRRVNDFRALAVKTPGKTSNDQHMHLEDLAVLCGGRQVVRASGETLQSVKMADLGQARHAWADMEYMGVINGKGDPQRKGAHIQNLRRAYDHASETALRLQAQRRVGQLMGGAATIFVGGLTESEIRHRKSLAERAEQVMRSALREGALPGGGMAFIACIPALNRGMENAHSLEEQTAYRILAQAMQEPLQVIAQNAGYSGSAARQALADAGAGYGFDVLKGKAALLADMPMDVHSALSAAVQGSVAGAALLLTTDAIVHKALPDMTFNP